MDGNSKFRAPLSLSFVCSLYLWKSYGPCCQRISRIRPLPPTITVATWSESPSYCHIVFYKLSFFSNPAPYSLLSSNYSEWSFLKPKSDSATSLHEILTAKMRKGDLYNDLQGLIWSPLTPFSPRPHRLLILILSAILFTSSVIVVPSLMATPTFLALLLPMKSTPSHTMAFELAISFVGNDVTYYISMVLTCSPWSLYLNVTYSKRSPMLMSIDTAILLFTYFP